MMYIKRILFVLLLFSIVNCDILEDGNVPPDGNTLFITKVFGTYIRSGKTFDIDKETGDFVYESTTKSFVYTFLSAENENRAIYEMGDKFYGFTLSGAQLRRTAAYGSADTVKFSGYIVYANKAGDGDTDDGNDTDTGEDDSNPEIGGGDGDGGAYPSEEFLNKIGNQTYEKNNYYFEVTKSGDFLYQGEEGYERYKFDSAVGSSQAIYQRGSSYYGVSTVQEFDLPLQIHITDGVTRPNNVAFFSSRFYASQSDVDYTSQFKSNLGATSQFTKDSGGTPVFVGRDYGLTDIGDGSALYTFYKSVNSENAVYKKDSAYYGFAIKEDDLYRTQRGQSSSSSEEVQFDNQIIWARRNI